MYFQSILSALYKVHLPCEWTLADQKSYIVYTQGPNCEEMLKHRSGNFMCTTPFHAIDPGRTGNLSNEDPRPLSETTEGVQNIRDKRRGHEFDLTGVLTEHAQARGFIHFEQAAPLAPSQQLVVAKCGALRRHRFEEGDARKAGELLLAQRAAK